MTEPVANKKVQLSAYTGLNAGVVRNASKETYAKAGAILGGEVNWRGAFARGEVGVGTATSTDLQLGYEFDLGKNMGLELSANAHRSLSLTSKGTENINSTTSSSVSIITPDKTYDYQIDANSNMNMRYPKGETRIGAQAKLTFGNSNAKFGVGINGGIHNSTRPNMNLSQTTVIDIAGLGSDITSQVVSVSNDSKGYVTPTISADVKLSKHLSFNANADLYQGQAGIRYNF